jgi:hypothetical protein
MGRKPSGAERRRVERNEKEAGDRASADADDSQFDYAGGADRFKTLGAPDFEQSETALEFTRKYLLESLYQIGNDRSFKARERHRLLKDCAIAIGATHPRQSIENQFRKLRDARNKIAVVDATRAAAPSGPMRPSTARKYPTPNTNGVIKTPRGNDDDRD